MQISLNYNDRKLYPDFPESIPDELLNEDWADKIHSQTLKRLNERGGLDVVEAIVNIKKLPYSAFNEYNKYKAIEELLEILNNYKNND